MNALLTPLFLLPFLATLCLGASGDSSWGKSQAPKGEKNAPAQQGAQDDPFAPVTDNPALPRVLIIGDMMSIGYSPIVRDQMKNRANIHRVNENCKGTDRGAESLDEWLGDGKWDVIFFNFGLYDMVQADAKAPCAVPVAQYGKNLEVILKRLKQTQAVLIFASTTPVAARMKTDKGYWDPRSVSQYNEAAEKLMKQNGVKICDLHNAAKERLKDIQMPTSPLFTSAGNRYIAEKVAEAIDDQLKGWNQKKTGPVKALPPKQDTP